MRELASLCMAGGFPLQKWCSNSPDIIKRLNLSSSSSPSSKLWEESSTKVLGIRWDHRADVLEFQAKPLKKTIITKRTILSEIAQIYNPLGLISPVIVRAKMIMQKLWLIKAGWDEELPETTQHQWNQFRESLQHLEKIKISRWIHLSSEPIKLQLHGFADASNDAMGAAIYIRVTCGDQQISTNLVCAKTKAAPLKRMTIPRLELTAAVMVAELASYVKDIIEKPEIETYLWTDSSVALTWIKSHLSRWKDFVSNRVQKIQELQPNAIWRHINGTSNAADCASRGVTPDQLANHHLWWHGPVWLNHDQSDWPTPVINIEPSSDVAIEEKPARFQSFPVQLPEEDEFLSRYSSLTRMLKIFGLVIRLRNKIERRPCSNSPVATPHEIELAKLYWVSFIQRTYFEREINIPTENGHLPASNTLAKLRPILDDKGILRVGGRLKNARIDYEQQHQIIIPRRSQLTTLILREAHQKTQHGGTQLTLAQIRQQYWIVGGPAPVRSYILKCIICARWRQIRAKQLMGQLPSERLNASRAFEHTGVDFAGPVHILRNRGYGPTTYTCYIAVFICMVTSAIHVKLVTKYTAEAFIAAYKRFTSRRGICKTLNSDNGSNFIGASNELKELCNQHSRQLKKIASVIATDGTEWKFIPPYASHFGGKWEAAVKSVKYHLRRIIGGSYLTYEEFTTLLCQVEAVVNSRPLSPLTDDPEDCEALTSGHFLVGHPLTSILEPSLLELNSARLNRWQTIAYRLQQFWDRWHRECIQIYQAINKWMRPEENLKIGSLVLITDENYPPLKWPLARVIVPHVTPGVRRRRAGC